VISTTDKSPLSNDPNNRDERESSIRKDHSLETNQQINRNIHRRVKEGDDSFEEEHRNAPPQQRRAKTDTGKYFNNRTFRKTATMLSSVVSRNPEAFLGELMDIDM
jgi:hypothetical protein